MKPEDLETANLDALVHGFECSAYQRALAKRELEKLKNALKKE